MKKILSLAAVALFCTAIGFAGDMGKGVEGTITKVDSAAKTMVVKASDGTETTVYWNDATKVEGTPKEGEMVHIKTSEKDGKVWATAVHVGKMEHKKN